MCKKVIWVSALSLVLLISCSFAQDDVIYDDFDDNRNVSAYFVGGDDKDGGLTEAVSNPFSSEVNDSANVGQFDKTAGANKVFGGDVEAQTALPPYGYLLVYSELATPFKLSLQDSDGNELASAEADYSQTSEWQDIGFDFSEADLQDSIAKFVIVVFAEDEGVIYFDNLQFKDQAPELTESVNAE